ncbi:MAG: hypothetical protein EXR75_14680 [Myxococcales bacterium]|nr:hypothetical protein [Myxococcales bacterium]
MAFFNQDDDGAKTVVFMGGSETVLGFAAGATRRRRVVLIALGAGLAVAVIGAFAVTRYLDADAARRIVDSYGSLSRCLLGEPLGEGERASMRFRAVQLDALSLGETKRSKGAAWPDRCATHAHALAVGLGASNIVKAKAPTLLDETKAVADALEKKDGYWQDASRVVDAMFDSAAAAGLVRVEKPEVEAPARARGVLSIDEPGRGAALTNKATDIQTVHPERHASKLVRFLVGDPTLNTTLLCEVAADRASCAPVAKSILEADALGARLLGTASDDATPVIFAARGKKGSFRSTGERLSTDESHGAHADKSGRIAVLETRREVTSVLTIDGARTESHRIQLRGPELLSAQLLWGRLVVVGTGRDGLSLASGTVNADGPSALENIGVLAGANRGKASAKPPLLEDLITGCEMAGGLVVRVATGGARAGSAAGKATAARDFLAFRAASGWSPPFALPRAGGALSCRGGEASVTRVDAGASALDAVVSHNNCGTVDCRETRIVLSDLLAGEVGLAPTEPLWAVGLEDKLLVVWQAAQRGGLRMRLAPPGTIATAADVILFDDLVANGVMVAESRLFAVRLLPAERFVVVLLSTSKGLRAIRVSANGTVTPVTI